MSFISESGIYDTSARFRMYLIAMFGIFAFGAVMYWRIQLLVSSEYVEIPNPRHIEARLLVENNDN